MRILLLCHAFNALAQRLFVELSAPGREIAIAFDVNEATTAREVERFRPDLVIAPFLKRRIAEAVWSRVPCLIVHPGVPGDRGPSSLDWAILEGEAAWGVTVLQATGDMDAGPVWAHREFPMRLAPKSSLYRREVTEAAVLAVSDALERMARGERPVPAAQLGAAARGRSRPLVRQADRAIDWSRDTTDAVLRKIHSADGAPGVLDDIHGLAVHLFGAHREALSCDARPGTLIAQRDGAILRATTDGGVWITHLRRASVGAEPELKLPAAEVLAARLADVPERPIAIEVPRKGPTWREIRYEERGPVGILHFAFHNGAMSAAQSRRLIEALAHARSRPTRVLVLAGGPDFWSNGIHLNAIEESDHPADASWESINAIDDVARALVTDTDRLTVAALAGNAGAGGAFLALAADRVWLRAGVVLNPHYKGMGNLYGSEYWTYLLPRRVGEAAARRITERRLPMGSAEALRLGIADGCFGTSPEDFLGEAVERALQMAEPRAFAEAIRAKRERRERDEAEKPLERYREEELARMKLNFYGFDPSYHVARYHFARKLPKARTPGYLARQAQESNVA